MKNTNIVLGMQANKFLGLAFVVTSFWIQGCQASKNQSVTTPDLAPPAAGQAEQPVEAQSGVATQELTGPQLNAIKSARQYLSISGFSRDGLINQLSSDAGDGYDLADATFAVDSLNVDWNEQAVRSAKQYLGLSGFSCDGLVEQLSSSAGDKYTPSQASYGAHQAGACN